MKASQIVEGVLFASDAPLKAEEIARADESLDEDRVQEAVQELRTLYDESERAFQILEVGEGYQLLTRPDLAPYLERFDTVPRPSRLSGPALETLAIIAYRQPIGRIEIEYIRGVQASGVIRTLQDRDLIEVVGRAEGLGRPLLYGTTRRFLEHFGFASLDDLPRPEDLPILLRDRAPLDDLMAAAEAEERAPAPQLELEPEPGAASKSESEAEGRAPESEPEATEERAPESEAESEPEGTEEGAPDSEIEAPESGAEPPPESEPEADPEVEPNGDTRP